MYDMLIHYVCYAYEVIIWYHRFIVVDMTLMGFRNKKLKNIRSCAEMTGDRIWMSGHVRMIGGHLGHLMNRKNRTKRRKRKKVSNNYDKRIMLYLLA